MPRITGKDAEGLLAAYAKVHAPKDEVVEEQPTKEGDVEELKEDQEQLNELGGLGLGGLMKRTPQQQQAKPQLSGAQRAQQMAKNRIAQGRNTVTGQVKPQAGGQQGGGLGSRIKSGLAGGLSKLGNLAGRAVGGIKRVAGGVADKLTGDRFDFDKRGPSGGGNAQGGGQSSGVKPTRQQVQTARADTTSPAAKAGLSSDMRAQAAAKTDAFNKANNRGKYSKPGQKSGGRPNTGGYNSGPSHTWDSYDPMADVYDDTVNFLVSEGYTEEQSLAIMSEPMFIEAFNEGFTEVLNEQKEV